MMSNDDREIPTRLEELYQAELEIDPAPSAEINAAWQRFATHLPAPSGTSSSGGAEGGSASSSGTALGSTGGYTAAHMGAALAVGLVAGVFGGVALTSTMLRDTDVPRPALLETTPVAMSDAGITPSTEVVSTEESLIGAEPDAGTAQMEIAPRAAEREEDLSGTAALAAERRLIDSARFALARGDAEAALSSLHAHRRRYPQGRLAEERDGIEVSVLVYAGELDEARVRAHAFLQRYPGSLMLDAVQRAVASPRSAE